jgi:hypothetical protein
MTYRDDGKATLRKQGDGDGKIIDITQAGKDKAAAAEKASAAKKKQTFTSKKLDWVNYLMRDDQQQPIARLVGIAYAQTIKEETEISIASVRYIADVLGVSVRTIITSRQALRDGEWLAWHRPHRRSVNHTKLVLIQKNMIRIEDVQTARKDRRDFEENERRRR